MYQQILADLRHYEKTGFGAVSSYEAGQIADLLEEMNAELEKIRARDIRREKHWLERIKKQSRKIENLRIVQTALQAYKDYMTALYGEGYQVANWHLNGDLEPLDTFLDSADAEYESVLSQNGSSEAKVPKGDGDG